jgi:transcriptional regulator with XRE-family HTH domain
MTIGERLKLVRKKFKLKLDETAAIFDITMQTLSRYENGKRTPDNDFLEAFGNHFKLSGDWLLYGQPPIFRTADSKQDVNSMFLELAAVMTAESEHPGTDPKLVDLPMESLVDTPENFVLMLQYMLKYPEVCHNMFQFFYLFQKPVADKHLEPTKNR